MTIQSVALFSTPLHSTMLEGFAKRKDALVTRAHCSVAGDTVRASNQGPALHSARTFHHVTDLEIAAQWLMTALHVFVAEALTHRGPSKFSIDSCWAVVSQRGGFMTPHTHFPSPWAGVVYLDAERFCDPASPDRAGKLELFNPVPLADAFGQSGGAVLAPRDGMALLFPGSLSHMVHPHNSDGVRVSVSFNIGVKT